MHTLERRIVNLEKANPSADDIALIIRYVITKQPGAEIQYVRGDGGESWARRSPVP